MKTRLLIINKVLSAFLMLTVLLSVSFESKAQCAFPSNAWGSGTAPAVVGTSVNLTTCAFAGENAALNGVVAGYTYQVSSSLGDYFTIYQTTNTTTPVAFGAGPLTFVAPASGNYWVVTHLPGCGAQSNCRSISVTLIATGPCTSPPNAGVVSAPASACPGGLTLTLTGASTGQGLVIQWESSTDSFVWGPMAGVTGASVTIPHPNPMYYRAVSVCSGDSSTSNAVFVGVNSFLTCYCGVSFPTAVEPITLVQFASINNVSSGTVGGTPALQDFSSITADVVQGLTYPITVNGNTDGNFTSFISVYIDWNQNGLLTDVGEAYQIGSIVNCANCGVTGSIQVPANAQLGATKMRVIKKWNAIAGPCNTDGFGQAEDYTLNILAPPANEAGVLAITKPEIAACSLGQDLFVEVQNLGTDTLTSADFQVTVSGLVLPVANWTGSVPPQSSQEIQIPILYVFADGDSVSVTVSNPNGVAEDPLFAFNNFVGRRVRTALSGVKTVYGVGADYADIDAAVDALELRGVCDTVFFQIASGNYTTQHKFTPYLGAGAGKLAVFESATGNAADVTFAFAGTSTANNYVFQFDAGDFYMLRNLTATNTGATFGTVVDIRNGADDLTFEGNKFIGDTIGTNVVGDFDRIVVASVQATTDQRTVLRNNDIIGGTRAIVMAAPAGQYEFGHVIENNNIIQNTAMGALLGSVSNPVVKGNTVRNRTNVTGEAYSIIVNGAIDGGLIGSNDFATQRTGAVIYLINAKGGSNEFVVANNFINSADSVGLSRGIWIQDVNSTAIALVNNSISFNSDNATAGAITITDGSQIRLLNNNVGAFGNAPAARIEKAYSVSESNNNNIFGTSIANLLGVNYTTLAAFQAASGTDANSVSVNPGFNGTDLHTCAPELNGAGLPVAFITDDFDGDPRSSTPDIGADEFVGDANSLLAEDEFLKCPSDVVTLGNTALNGVTYSWTPSGSTSEISTSDAGTFVVTATSSCGSFSDTAVVVNKPLPTASFTSSTVGLAAIFTNTSTNGTSYLWDFGDGNSSTEMNPTHVYSSAATYSVTLTVTNDCGTDTFGPIPASVLNVSIEENELASVSLFPNPTNGSFTVTMNNMGADASVITVIDVTGKVVMVKNVPAGENQVTLDATSFASGIYSVKIANGDFSKVIRLVRK